MTTTNDERRRDNQTTLPPRPRPVLDQTPTYFDGFSLTICMSSGLSTSDGAGLGTLGFTEKLAEEMTQDAGFSGFKNLEVDTPLNNYYLLTK